ncbi:MAG: hypothetical protein Kow0042_08060 [Calditrichia bacterium]
MNTSEKVSIIIPCRNEDKYIAHCLESIVQADFEKDNLEVLVVDGQSDDHTVEIVNYFIAKYSFIRLVENPHRTTPFALNIGIREAKGETVIILGAHSEIDKKFIQNSVDLLKAHPECGCVGGIIENIYEDSLSQIISLGMSSRFGVGNAHFRTGKKSGYVDTTAFGAYRKSVFQQIGLFDEELIRNQDDEFNYRLTRAGYKIFLSPSIRSKYYVRSSFKKLFKQYFQYGYWKVYVNKKYGTITTVRQLIPFLFVLFLGGGALLSLFVPSFFPVYAGILLFYVALCVIMANKKIKGFKQKLQLIYTFFILHFSYGVGYVEGIFNFLFLNKKPNIKHAEITR